MTEMVLSMVKKIAHRTAANPQLHVLTLWRYDHPAVGCLVTSCVHPFLTLCIGSQDD